MSGKSERRRDIIKVSIMGIMEFVSILDYKECPHMEVGRPEFFVDLNIDQIIKKIQFFSLVPVEKYYYMLPVDKECENYRRDIYGDVKNPEVNKALTEFKARYETYKEDVANKNEVEIGIQRNIWQVLEIADYCETFGKLCEELDKAVLNSAGLIALRDMLKAYTGDEKFIKMRERAISLKEKLQSFRVKIVYENEQIYVTEEEVEGIYENFLQEHFNDHGLRMKSPFSQTIHLNNLEQEIVRKFIRKETGFFKDAEAFHKKYAEYENEVLIRFGEEIDYYLSYYAFQQKMELAGFAFTTPTVDEDKDISATGLYDLALACANMHAETDVVSNDMYYGSGEKFIVVTGPNQGGKTTFARSLGQLIYFSKMGLDVPAVQANVHSFKEILTHFSVEESVETGRGKLMDELLRLKPMMAEEAGNAFVVINELFTTAANYDACIMGQKVLLHFIENNCKGIYVTHLKELTEAHESVVSMRAMLDENKVQNFKILRKEADDSACAMNQVNKYNLTYEQLKERLR